MKILLAVDGSDQSYEAVRSLCVLAPAEELVILHVMHLPHLSYPIFGSGLDKDLALTVEQAMKEEGEQLLDRMVSLLPPHHGSPVKRLESGSPAEVILSTADSMGADLIVLGARGLSALQEHVFGSVSHRVMTHAPCAVLVVKSPLRQLQELLVPIGNPEDGQAIGDLLLKQPFREPPAITVLHVLPFATPVWPVGALIPEAFRKEMLSYAEEMTGAVSSRLTAAGYQAKGRAVMGPPAESIAQEAATLHVDLVMMRSHSRSGISRFLLGSVSHSVMHQIACSFLLVKGR
ncbi:MAG: universal stress protein [Nitrospirae bacterium]|nr:MAG: universal stress protein [Nitrospirota bacterium]